MHWNMRDFYLSLKRAQPLACHYGKIDDNFIYILSRVNYPMDLNGMYMLKTSGYSEEKIYEALEMLYKDRKNEFREIAQAFMGGK